MKRRIRSNRFFNDARRRRRPLFLEAVEPRVLLSTLLVNSAADTNARDAVLTLREAIMVANGDLAVGSLTAQEQGQVDGAAAPVDLIHFDLPGTGVQTIAATSPLPDITDSVVIDGASQPGYAGTPLVRLLGSGAGATTDGLRLTAGTSTIRGLAIVGFGGAGIAVNGDGNTIQGNYLGFEADGVTTRGNLGGGVVVTSANNVIGGTTVAERNLIAGNGGIFQASTNLSTAATPQAVAVFPYYNGVASMDGLATLDANGDIETRLSNGDGTFQSPVLVANLSGASLLAVAGANYTIDLNWDFNADLVVADTESGDIHALFGDGGGAFGAPVWLATVADPRALTVLRGDIVVASGAAGGSIQVLPNDGSGVFGAPITLAPGVVPSALAVASFGFDPVTFETNWAIVAANRDANTVTVLERNGDGTYQPPVTLAVGTAPVAITAADLTKDGLDDILVANSGGDNITVYLRVGGGFSPPRTFAVGDSPSGVVVGDFDGDRQADIAVSNSGDGTVSLILRKPSSQLFSAGAYAVGSDPFALVTGHFSGDEFDSPAELVTANGSGDGLSVLLTNNGPADGITLTGAGATGNTIQGNWIGVNVTGNAAPGNVHDGVSIIAASNNLIGGSTPGAGNLISGNARYGVGVLGGSTDNTIQGNRIGANAAGDAALGNFLAGVAVIASGNNHVLDNLISGNLQHGVMIRGLIEQDDDFNLVHTDAPDNVIQGNTIGLNAAGDSKLGNARWGISIEVATGTIIGGSTSGLRNIISGNGDHGVDVRGLTVYDWNSDAYVYLGVEGAKIVGNYIGVDATGASGLGNGGEGVYLDKANQVTIGGPGGLGNLISDNGDDGIALRSSNDVVIQGNRIGSNAAGTAALGNGRDSSKIAAGLFLADSANALVGGSAPGEGNLISGNIGRGILVSRPKTQGARILGNQIGVDASGLLPLPNTLDGITIHNSASNNVIGGTSPGEGNVIAFNLGAGIRIDLGDEPEPADQLPTGNELLGNLIHQNVDGGIISPASAATPTPIIASAFLDGGSLQIDALLHGDPGALVQVEFFATIANTLVFLGSGDAVIAPDGSGRHHATFGGAPAGISSVVATATSTNPLKNTSDFSAPYPLADEALVDLSIGQTVAPTSGVVGENLVYTITVGNLSGADGHGVVVTSNLPAGLAFVSSSIAPATNSGGVLTFNLGTLAANATRTFTLTVRPSAAGSFVHLVSVAGDETDPNPSNNSSTLRTTVESPPAPVADLRLGLVVSPASAFVGQNLTFTYTVTNAGPDAAANTVFTLVLPSDGVNLISVTPSQGGLPLMIQAAQANPPVVVNLGDIAAGASATIVVVLQPTAPGNLVTEANVTSDAANPNPGDGVVNGAIPVQQVPATGPPAVTSLERIGVHLDPTLLLIGFSEPLNPATAENLNNYVLVYAGPDGRIGTRDDRLIALASATYDAASQTVVLAPRLRLPLRAHYGLQILGGPDGVIGQDGQLLDGAGDGEPGGDYHTTFGAEIWRGGRVTPQRPTPGPQRQPILAPPRRRPIARALPTPRGPQALFARPAAARAFAMRQALLRG